MLSLNGAALSAKIAALRQASVVKMQSRLTSWPVPGPLGTFGNQKIRSNEVFTARQSDQACERTTEVIYKDVCVTNPNPARTLAGEPQLHDEVDFLSGFTLTRMPWP